jgi:hypothetical protein
MNRALFTLVMSVLLCNCRPATDLNTACPLVKRNPDGGAPIPLLESEVRNAQGHNKDFISIGSVVCEDLVCVRDSSYVSDAGADETAMGYCSRRCAQGSLCPSQDEKLDKGPLSLSCRALLLSAETLAALGSGDAGFAGVRDPYFCARGTDGGT